MVIDMIRNFRNWRVCILTAMILASSSPTVSLAQEQMSVASTTDALHAALINRHSSMFADGAPDPLFDFYASRNFSPAWTGRRNDVNFAAAVLSTLSHADTQGLRVDDYSATETKWSAPPEAGPDAADFELSLMTDLMRYAADVRLGRLNPARVYQDVDLPVRTFEFVGALNTALKTGNIESFLADLPPQQPQYQGLIRALATYRMRQSNGGWSKVPGSGEVALDGSTPSSRALIARLAQEDVQFAENSAPSVDDVRNALTSFQARNGIHADGRAGAMTLAVLNVPLDVRIAQILANLERWRWMQRSFEDRYILVNVPDQTVKLIENGQVSLDSRAIVGRLGSKTPITRLLAGALVINPPWHVPEDIAAAQILPKLRQNPNYLSDKNMVLANGPADDPHGRTLNWRKMKTMPYLIDQNPGPGSAMGELMLDSPSSFGVYLHDTPGKALFQASTRLASNGCIRVENMLELSALILGGEKENTADQLRADIAAGQTQQLSLETPVPIYLLYQTAIAYSDGTVGFRPDVYGRDKPLLAALMTPVR
jgi:murein L,D-transpeptidase YcbB/YkuD